MSIANIFRAKIIDVGVDSLIIELTGTESKIEAFFKLLGDYEILELARTGMTGLSRGAELPVKKKARGINYTFNKYIHNGGT